MRFALLSLSVLSACATFPVLEGTVSDAARQAPYPELSPLPSIAPVSPEATADAYLQSRIAALNARAARLRATQFGALQ